MEQARLWSAGMDQEANYRALSSRPGRAAPEKLSQRGIPQEPLGATNQHAVFFALSCAIGVAPINAVPLHPRA